MAGRPSVSIRCVDLVLYDSAVACGAKLSLSSGANEGDGNLSRQLGPYDGGRERERPARLPQDGRGKKLQPNTIPVGGGGKGTKGGSSASEKCISLSGDGKGTVVLPLS